MNDLKELFNRGRAWVDARRWRPAAYTKKTAGDEFIEKVVAALDRAIEAELIHIGDRILVPKFYRIYIGEEEDRRWPGERRAALIDHLNRRVERILRLLGIESGRADHVRLHRVNEPAGPAEIRVEPEWQPVENPISIEFRHLERAGPKTAAPDAAPGDDTIIAAPFWTTAGVADDELETVWQPPSARLFSLEIWQHRAFRHLLPVFQPELTIGRGAATATVDLQLTGDPEISRRAGLLVRAADGVFRFRSANQNPVYVGGRPLRQGETAEFPAGEFLLIGTYAIKCV
ncbi:MAG: FHA domain-containing protein [Acidobacteria bacterium]|nr:FHA domain-containing protein [Acidobacteriota bacterium]